MERNGKIKENIMKEVEYDSITPKEITRITWRNKELLL